MKLFKQDVLDSLATMDIPAIGYGIHYEFGLFRQTFAAGRQVEVADNWLANNNPWLIRRPNFRVTKRFSRRQRCWQARF